MQSNAKDVCELVKIHIKSELNGRLLSLKLGLTHHMNRCVFGVNVQFYVGDKLIVRTLGMKRLLENTVAVNLAIALKEILEDYNINIKNIYTITTDNGTNEMYF